MRQVLKKKIESKPRHRSSKEKSKTTGQDLTQEPEVKDKKERSDQPQKAKKEKKQKQEKKEKKLSKDAQAACKQEKEECERAYMLVARLIDQYCGDGAALIKSKLLEKSDSWDTAIATYKGAYSSLSKKEGICPELLGILLYWMENIKDAKEKISLGTRHDPYSLWYKALSMLRTDAATPDRNKGILALVDEVLANSIAMYPVYKGLLVHNAQLDQLINDKADQDIAGGINKVRALLYKLLFINNALDKDSEDELNLAHNNGSILATIHYAQMYAYGIFVKPSLSKALAILQESLTKDPNGNKSRLDLLEEISNLASEHKDQIAQLTSDYLHVCEKLKLKENENIVQFLAQMEQRVATTAKSKKDEAAKLLASTGALDFLIAQAEVEKNKVIATYLRDIACSRVTLFNHPKEHYAKAFELVRKLGIKQIVDFETKGTVQTQHVKNSGLVDFCARQSDAGRENTGHDSTTGEKITDACNSQPSTQITHEKHTVTKLEIARMYVFGDTVPQSFSSALIILQSIVNSSETTDQGVIDLLGSISDMASQKHDIISSMHSVYLLAVVMTKLTDDTTYAPAILQQLKYAEEQLQQLDGDLFIKAAKLFKESGAYDALLPLSKKNTAIADFIEYCTAVRMSLEFPSADKFTDIT